MLSARSARFDIEVDLRGRGSVDLSDVALEGPQARELALSPDGVGAEEPRTMDWMHNFGV
eukprot:442820-Pyramimonas_sp.AAC.2